LAGIAAQLLRLTALTDAAQANVAATFRSDCQPALHALLIKALICIIGFSRWPSCIGKAAT
jgi:hypothetical protein